MVVMKNLACFPKIQMLSWSWRRHPITVGNMSITFVHLTSKGFKMLNIVFIFFSTNFVLKHLVSDLNDALLLLFTNSILF